MSWLTRMVERQTAKARAEGKLSGLEGEGRPLPDRPGDAFVDPGVAAGFRIMAEAGALPEEIRLGKEIEAVREAYARAGNAEERARLMAALAELEMRRGIAEDARRHLFR